MKEYVSIGKNVDIAIEEGLRFLGLNREDVDIKVLETGGLFKKAKVCLIYEEKVELEPETIVEEVKTGPSIEPVIEQEVEISAKIDETVELAEVEPKEQEAKPVETETKPVVAPDELKARVEQFLVDLAKKMNMDVTV